MALNRRCGYLLGIVLLTPPGVGGDGGTLSAPDAERHALLQSKPLQSLTNLDMAEYLSLRNRVVEDSGNRLQDNIEHFATRSLGGPFRLNAVQFDMAESDCVSFVNRTLALSLASDWTSYFLITERLRHKDGLIDYRSRNFHTLGDWLPNNTWILRDVTPELGELSGCPVQSFTHAVRPKLFDEKPAAPGSRFTRITFRGSDYTPGRQAIVADTYVPTSALAEISPHLTTGDVALVLRNAAGGHLGCDHMGLVVRTSQGVVLVHSAPSAVRQESFFSFSERCHWVVGLKFLRLRENALELAKQEVSRLRTAVSSPDPAEQDRRVVAMRTARTGAAKP